jgi:hypothetical protein
MSENSHSAGDQAAAFQKLWMDSLSKMMQTAFTFGPDSAPPEVMREIRSGFFQAMAKSWEEFLRSPQFLEGMKQWMDSAVGLRKLTNDLLARTRNDLQAPSREDIDTIMLNGPDRGAGGASRRVKTEPQPARQLGRGWQAGPAGEKVGEPGKETDGLMWQPEECYEYRDPIQ